MQVHGPSTLEGPVSRTRAWWPGADQRTRKSSRRPDADKGIRTHLVERARREIAEGTYDTPEKWDIALDRLFLDLDRE